MTIITNGVSRLFYYISVMKNDQPKANLFLLGSMKSGTTTLACLLEEHPEICFSKKKEPNLFSHPDTISIEEYSNLFDYKGEKYIAEGSTCYTQYPHHSLDIWEKIKNYNPDSKFIYIIRNPIDRIVSQYMHMVNLNGLIIDFETALKHLAIMLDTSRHYFQIQPFIDAFGKDAVHIMVFEDLIENDTSMNHLASFLDIDPHKFRKFGDIHLNQTEQAKRSYKFIEFMNGLFRQQKKNNHQNPIDIKKWLINNPPLLNLIKLSLREDMQKLEELLDRDFKQKWFG